MKLTPKQFITNILSELSEIGEKTDLEEYYNRIMKRINKWIKIYHMLIDCGWCRNTPYIEVKEFRKAFEIQETGVLV